MAGGEPVFDMYNRLEFVLCSGTFNPCMKPDGAVNKNFIHDSASWKDSTQRRCLKNRTGYALLTGAVSDVTAIDIDDPDAPALQSLRRLLLEECNMIAKTRKGNHYLFMYDPRIRTVAKAKIGVDTRNDGGLLYVAPSRYRTPSPANESVEYTWDVTPEDMGEEGLRPLSDAVFDALKALDRGYIMPAKADDVDPPAQGEIITHVASDPIAVGDEGETILLRLAAEITNNDTYDDWLRNGMICFNEGLGLGVWETMSRKAAGYEAGACAKKWASFSHTGERKITQATWWKWLKDNKPDRFAELKHYRSDVVTLLETINHNDIAKYFYNLYPTSYVFNKALGWYALGTNNIWERADKGVPNALKRHLADTMQDLTREAKSVQTAKHKRNMDGAKAGTEDRAELLDHQNKMRNIIAAYKLFGSSEFCNGVISFLPAYYEDEHLTEKMDMNRSVFAFTDGLYDIEKETFRAIEPRDWVCTTTGYPIPRVSVPTVRSELTTLMWNIFEDTEVTEYMWSVLSSALLGTNRWEELYTFTGSGGNGKGVLSELLKTAFGAYYISQDVSLFTKPRERADQPMPALVEARPCRLFMTTEPEADDKLQCGLLKKVTGGDTVEARTLHSQHIVKYVPQFTLIIQTNTIPRLNKIDGGIQRRLRIIRFPFQFVASPTLPHHRHGDPDVKDRKCKSPAWRDEFVLMLIERLQTIRKWKALVPPAKVKEVTGGYLDEHNPLKEWLSENYVITHWDEDRISASEMRADFNATHPDAQLTTVKFKELMGYNGLEAKRGNRGVCFCGLKPKIDTIDHA
jgi:P4 family phage/plasmid primase-like protien